MKRRGFVAALACVLAISSASPAYAGNSEGKIHIKAFGTGVLPDGAIDEVKADLIGLPAGTP